jgi:IS4 transposase
MSNDEKLTLRDVIELYQLRWQIELFFKELKSTLGLHHYRFKKFEKAETWVTLCLVTFVYLEWIRARKLKQKALKKKEREWWQAQRTSPLKVYKAVFEPKVTQDASELGVGVVFVS